MEARAGIEPAIGLLQSPALPLGDLAIDAIFRPAKDGWSIKATSPTLSTPPPGFLGLSHGWKPRGEVVAAGDRLHR